MSSRWRERKGGTFVSASELASRKKALLAPVSKWKRAWVQPSPMSSYKVLRWVPRHSTDDAGGAVFPYDDPLAIDASDESSSSDSGEDDEVVVGDAPTGTSPSATKKPRIEGESREARLERKMNKAVAAAERGGAQLAGLETGETAEDVVSKHKLPRSGAASGTATPAEVPGNSSAASVGSLSALGGLDGGTAARLVRHRLGGGETTGGSTTPAMSTPGTVTPPTGVPTTAATAAAGHSGLNVQTNAPVDPSPLRREETAGSSTAAATPAGSTTNEGGALAAAIRAEADAEDQEDVEMQDTQTFDLDTGDSPPPAVASAEPDQPVPTLTETAATPAPPASELPDAAVGLPPPEPELEPAPSLPEPEGQPEDAQPIDATEASALLVGKEEGGMDVAEGVQQGLDGQGATDEEMQELAVEGMGAGSVS